MLTIGESIGIEIEFNRADRKSVEFNERIRRINPKIKVVHDASCETPVYQFRPHNSNNKVTIISGDLLPPMGRVTEYGGELVTDIMHAKQDNWKELIYQVVEILTGFCDSSADNRDSFHVHVNVSDQVSLTFLQNMIRAIKYFEVVFYKLGGLGRENRGVYNDYIFQRPYTKPYGPPIDAKKYPTFVVDDLLSSVTKTEFWNRLNFSLHNKAGGRRYVTSRYMVVNLWSILNLGSVEFRSANKVLNAEYMIAWVEFCISFVNWVFYAKGELDLPEHSVFDFSDLSMDVFEDMLKLLDLGETTTTILKHLWKISPEVVIYKGYVYSHLDGSTWSDYVQGYLPNRITLPIRKPDGYVNVHQIRLNDARKDARFCNKLGSLRERDIFDKIADYQDILAKEERQKFNERFRAKREDGIFNNALRELKAFQGNTQLTLPKIRTQCRLFYFPRQMSSILLRRNSLREYYVVIVRGKRLTYTELIGDGLIHKSGNVYKMDNGFLLMDWLAKDQRVNKITQFVWDKKDPITVNEVVDFFRNRIEFIE